MLPESAAEGVNGQDKARVRSSSSSSSSSISNRDAVGVEGGNRG